MASRKNTQGPPPPYDPSAHADPAMVVRVEMACRCSAIRRHEDPIPMIKQVVAEWARIHAGPGHGPVSTGEAISTREATRKSLIHAAGGDYRPREHPDLIVTDTVTDWPTVGRDT